MLHELKTWPRYFEAVIAGQKTFELRKADRPFAPGDVLLLQEWDPSSQKYTGRYTERLVTYVTDESAQAFGMAPGFVCLGLADSEHDRLEAELERIKKERDYFESEVDEHIVRANKAEQERDEARAGLAQFRAAQIAYASEFPSDHPNGPDVGRIHENIRALKDAYFLSQVAESEARAEVGRLRKALEAIAGGIGPISPGHGKGPLPGPRAQQMAQEALKTEHNASR